MDNQENLKNLDEVEYETLELELEDGRNIECIILDIFEVEGESYIALIDKDESTEEIFFYGYEEINDEDVELKNIEDEDLFDKVVSSFEEIYFKEE
ncbi:hypothetical protein ING2D1G_0828 [Peptoniphilus sp. ING2-D1G]|nr:hypothetical protein ING2D1G_0828 [Peptoniphilus sp. ING2-D1G]